MKRFLGFAATIISVGVAITLAGCGGCSCAGCGGDTKNPTLTNSNWFTGTNYKGIQPSFIEGNENFQKEVLSYKVSHEAAEGTSGTFTVDYTEGSYRTEFYATKYNWNESNIPENYRNEKQEIVYVYKTTFSAKVQYTLRGEKSEIFEDSTEETCYFRAAGKNLQPIYSHQKIKSHSVANFQPTSLENAYAYLECEYTNYYDITCNEVTSIIKSGGKEDKKTVNAGASRNSLFDTSSLSIAVRSMKLSASSSQVISLYSATGGIVNYTVAGADTALSDSEKTALSEKLQSAGLYEIKTDDKGNKSSVSAVAATVSLAEGNLRGTTHTLWYAAIENGDNNVSRSTLLKMSLSLGYGMGNLVYTLDEVESTLWNG